MPATLRSCWSRLPSASKPFPLEESTTSDEDSSWTLGSQHGTGELSMGPDIAMSREALLEFYYYCLSVDCGLWTVDCVCGLWTVDCGLWTVDCVRGLWTVDCGLCLWTVDCVCGHQNVQGGPLDHPRAMQGPPPARAPAGYYHYCGLLLLLELYYWKRCCRN